MPKVTSKMQITLPKRLADEVGIGPGDDIEFAVAGKGLRLTPRAALASDLSTAERLRLFHEATARQEVRNAAFKATYGAMPASAERGWRRDELYVRDRPDGSTR
jgi:AbrB family looped-hinge helix DNA binding protein